MVGARLRRSSAGVDGATGETKWRAVRLTVTPWGEAVGFTAAGLQSFAGAAAGEHPGACLQPRIVRRPDRAVNGGEGIDRLALVGTPQQPRFQQRATPVDDRGGDAEACAAGEEGVAGAVRRPRRTLSRRPGPGTRGPGRPR